MIRTLMNVKLRQKPAEIMPSVTTLTGSLTASAKKDLKDTKIPVKVIFVLEQFRNV